MLFKRVGVHCVVDGQFGSTGKGALSAYLADRAILGGHIGRFAGAIYSGGPNSGHTFYVGGQKVVVKQLPAFSVYAALRGNRVPAFLSAGAVIDLDILEAEARAYPNLPIYVHPNAAIVTEDDKASEQYGTIAKVAGTRSGTGVALGRKVARDPKAIAAYGLRKMPSNVCLDYSVFSPEQTCYFMEVAQGFSLGINSHFYPKVTSRECTVMQGLADARISPKGLAMTYMAIRTFPIRVGDVDGHSAGGWYHDQREITWGDLKQPPEITTVTKRVRRVATFSNSQFRDALRANTPDVVFISHMDYILEQDRGRFIESILAERYFMFNKFQVYLGFGPNVDDIKEYRRYED